MSSDSYSRLKPDDENDGPMTPSAGSATSSSVDSNLSDNAFLSFPPLDERGGFPALRADDADETDLQQSDQAPLIQTSSDEDPGAAARGDPLGLDTVFEVTDESTAATPSVAADESTANASIPGSISTINKMSPAMSDIDGPAGDDAGLFFGKKVEDHESRSVASSDSAIALLVQGSQGSKSPSVSSSTRSTTSRQCGASSPDGDASWCGPLPQFKSFDKAQPVLVFGQFEIYEGDPLHYSEKEVFLKAYDHWANPASRVVLKLMNDPSLALSELENREDVDDAYVLKCHGVYIDQDKGNDLSYNGPIKLEKHEGLAEVLKTALASRIKRHATGINDDDDIDVPTFPYVLSLEPYDRTLEQVLLSSYLDLSVVRSVTKDAVVAIILLHTEKRIHGDIKPSSIVRVGSSWKLCDLQSSTQMGKPFDITGCNHGCMPPEVATRLLDTCAEENMPFVADSSYDLFSLGCILYHLIFGQSLWNVDKNGHISDVELKLLATWSSHAFLMKAATRFPTQQRTDDLRAAIDLTSKLLAPTPGDRRSNFEFGVVSVRQHEFLAGKPLEHESLDAFKAAQDVMFNSEKEHQSYLRVMQMLTLEERWEIKRAKNVLLLGVFEPANVHIPTSFVILKEKLPTKRPAEMTKREAKKRLGEGMKWVDNFESLQLSVKGALDGDVSSIGHFWVSIKSAGMFKGDAMYLYFIDELTGEPVRGDGTSNYPIEITTRSDTVPKLLPLMHLTMRAMALYHGVAGIARMFGCSLSALPEDLRSNAQGKINELKLEKRESPFGNIAADVETLASFQSQANKNDSARTKSVHELARFLEKKVGRNTTDFAGLTRYPDENGRAIWTLLKDPESFQKAIRTRAHERLAEERNQWHDSQREEIQKLEKDLAAEKDHVASLNKMLTDAKEDAEKASETAKGFEDKLSYMEKSLDETREQVTKSNKELEEAMKKCSCVVQ